MINKCEYCGKEYEAKTIRSKYCSRECNDNMHKQRMRESYVGKRLKNCQVCEKPLPRFKTKYCSDGCYSRAGHILAGDVQTKTELIRQCVVCGKEFRTWKSRKITCSDECHKRNSQRSRDLRYRGITVDSGITLKKLATRDKDICQLCGLKVDWTDYEIKGKLKICGNMYPSIDHIKPISLGGLHSWDNIQLVHRRCNSSKCNKFIG